MKPTEYEKYPVSGITEYFIPGESQSVLSIPAAVFEELSYRAFTALSFKFTQSHLEHLIAAALNSRNSPNDRYTASFLLRNAAEASKGILPLCQDTGIACVFGWKGSRVLAGKESAALSNGVRRAYIDNNLRFSTVRARSFFEEYDPRDNMPAQVMLWADSAPELCMPQNADYADDRAYRFLFCAKGGGSSNKTTLVQATKALLNPAAFEDFLKKQTAALGTAACPPYTICVVAGGLSPEQNLTALKLATAGVYDDLEPGPRDGIFRDAYWEDRLLGIAAETGLGAQFGGRSLAVQTRVLRLPRHGASCPVSVGVSCSAHRNLRGYIRGDGIYIEKTVSDPSSLVGFEEAAACAAQTAQAVSDIRINLDEGIGAARQNLAKLQPGTRVLLSGKLLVARDAAHARWKAASDEGSNLPDYLFRYAVCYAGPSETPPGRIIGSFGPTTAGRMDTYGEFLMGQGASLITIAKGNRSPYWTECCAKFGGFYLGTIGGGAALISGECITAAEIIDYPELGMEAVRLVTVRDLPAFLITDDKGKDFYEELKNNVSNAGNT